MMTDELYYKYVEAYFFNSGTHPDLWAEYMLWLKWSYLNQELIQEGY